MIKSDKIILRININCIGVFHYNFINIVLYSFKSFENCFEFVAVVAEPCQRGGKGAIAPGRRSFVKVRGRHNMNSLVRLRFVEYKLQV